MNESRKISVECPLDKHRCFRASCIEFTDTPELPCVGIVGDLAMAARNIGRANRALGFVADEDSEPEELKKTVKIISQVDEFADRLGVERKAFRDGLFKKINKL